MDILHIDQTDTAVILEIIYYILEDQRVPYISSILYMFGFDGCYPLDFQQFLC